MINGEGFKDSRSQLWLVLQNPDGSMRQPVTVADKSEAERLVYFHSRLYICDTLSHWISQRKNVFNHVGDTVRAGIAQGVRSDIQQHSKTSLKQLCSMVAGSEAAIKQVAPGLQSRYYNTYELLIIPILKFCKGDTDEL